MRMPKRQSETENAQIAVFSGRETLDSERNQKTLPSKNLRGDARRCCAKSIARVRISTPINENSGQ